MNRESNLNKIAVDQERTTLSHISYPCNPNMHKIMQCLNLLLFVGVNLTITISKFQNDGVYQDTR